MQTLHTIGTQGMNDERFIPLLKKHAVDVVVDVRLRNEGPRYRFASGRNIKALCETDNVVYLHESRFAPTAEMLKRFKVDADWDAYAAAYSELIQGRDMRRIWQEVAGRFRRPCLLCAEENPDRCHRRLLAEHVVGRERVIHIG